MDSSKKICTILVVDDEPMVRDPLTDMLNHYGYKSLSAANGIEALEIIDNGMPDMVITDINMPGMDGIELLIEIKARYDNLPVIIATGAYENINGFSMVKKMADGFLTKPFDIEGLNKLLQDLLCVQKTHS